MLLSLTIKPVRASIAATALRRNPEKSIVREHPRARTVDLDEFRQARKTNKLQHVFSKEAGGSSPNTLMDRFMCLSSILMDEQHIFVRAETSDEGTEHRYEAINKCEVEDPNKTACYPDVSIFVQEDRGQLLNHKMWV